MNDPDTTAASAKREIKPLKPQSDLPSRSDDLNDHSTAGAFPRSQTVEEPGDQNTSGTALTLGKSLYSFC